MNILIVDDRPCNLKLLRAVLEAEGLTVCEAADGLEALGVLIHGRVDAIISDILMPRMDGYRLCMEVRANHRFCDLPFIAYTATYTSDRDEKLMTDIGADRFLRKPASAAVLAATVEDVVQSHRRHPPGPSRARPENDLLKEYNERLAAKLEERNVARAAKIEPQAHVELGLPGSDPELRRVLDRSPAMIYGLKWEHEKIIPQVVSEDAARLLGFTVAETLSYDWWVGRLHPDDRVAALASIFETLARGASCTEYRLRHRDGSIRRVEDRRQTLHDDAGRPVGFTGVWTDITERACAQSRLALHHAVTAAFSETGSPAEINQKVLATLGAGLHWEFGELWMIERGAHVLRCTETWHVPSTEFREYVDKSRHLTFASGQGLPGRVLASGQPELRHRRVHPMGSCDWIGFPIKLRQEVVGVVGFFSRKVARPDEEFLAFLDTVGLEMGQFIERQQLGDQLRQAQKMEAIGMLAGGIAHDFNNILSGIYGYCDLARIEATGNPPLIEHLDAVMSGARRATDLVGQILAFSRQQAGERRPLQLRHVTAEAMRSRPRSNFKRRWTPMPRSCSRTQRRSIKSC